MGWFIQFSRNVSIIELLMEFEEQIVGRKSTMSGARPFMAHAVSVSDLAGSQRLSQSF